MTHINEQGVVWTLNESLTRWATQADAHGATLDGWTVWDVETPTGYRTRLLLDDARNVLCDSPQTETVACKIDWIKTAKRYEDEI